MSKVNKIFCGLTDSEIRLRQCPSKWRTKFATRDSSRRATRILLDTVLLTLLPLSAAIAQGTEQTKPTVLPSYLVVVNSDRDGTPQPDEALTLREAIALVNGTLPLEQLSEAEQAQVQPLDTSASARIEFNLPPAATTIRLKKVLPPIGSPGLVLDGTTQPGYNPHQTATAEIEIPIPIVTLTAAKGKEIFRGLTIVADGVTVRGLSIYGFSRNAPWRVPTGTTPGADIAIFQKLPADRGLSRYKQDRPPQNVTIEYNWLGLPPPDAPWRVSSFGVWIFDGVGTTIRRNRIDNHGGSGIITSVNASQTQITENIIVGNGLRGMPHAIYLDGLIDESLIANNLICGNDGSGIYLFKPDGSVTIQNNAIKFNGRRVESAAIYLIGNDHQVLDNHISEQTGPGVAIAAYPQSDRNLIENNRFAALEGLSIDLNTRDRVSNPFFQVGDGANPQRNSLNRRLDTANAAINAPQFLSDEFFLLNGKVNIDGIADTGSTITLYRVSPLERQPTRNPLAVGSQNYAPLSEPLAQVKVDEAGKFGFTLENLSPGAVISAIATDPRYGTSEPAVNAVIRSLEAADPDKVETRHGTSLLPNPPRCTTQPPVAVSQPPPHPKVIRLPGRDAPRRVPRNIHFALDQAKISSASTTVLNQIAAVLKEYPFLVIELHGHTDRRASDQYNLVLGRKRAIAARNYLLRQGIAPERITIRSFGESQLVQSGNSIVDHARNRRVEVRFRDVRGLEIDQRSEQAPSSRARSNL